MRNGRSLALLTIRSGRRAGEGRADWRAPAPPAGQGSMGLGVRGATGVQLRQRCKPKPSCFLRRVQHRASTVCVQMGSGGKRRSATTASSTASAAAFGTKQEAALAYDREARQRGKDKALNYESIAAAEEAAAATAAQVLGEAAQSLRRRAWSRGAIEDPTSIGAATCCYAPSPS
jgi:hypothetical protein